MEIRREVIQLIFYDFEVFKFNWLIKAIDPFKEKIYTIWDDKESLENLYQEYQSDIWVGCNNQHYDQYIKKGILCGFDPKKVNDHIIVKEKAGWQFSSLFKKFPSIEYDVMTRLDRGLKNWEGMMGNNIKETSVSFNIDRPLTEQEKRETEEYCQHDVEQTIEVFIQKKNEFDAQMGLIQMFPEVLDITDIGRTKAQISAKILECEKVERNDEFDLSVLPCIQLKKYKQAAEWFMNFSGSPKSKADEIYKESLKMIIAGIEHKLAWGGIHAGKEKYHNSGKKQGRQIWHVDVASFYPRLMIWHNLLTRNCKKPEKFKMIYDTRIKLKHAEKKKEQAPLKIVINGTYGISKAPTSLAYDPRNANLICMNGQLMLIDLIEHLEVIEGFELIQSNTDGLIVSLPDTDEAFYQMDDICAEWEARCDMELEFDEIEEIYQKDVNNYVFRFSNGKLERKGAYVKELNPLDYDLPIVNKALVDYMMNNVPVEKTIMECTDLKEFQMVKKASSKYSGMYHGTYEFCDNEFLVPLNEKCIRIFASRSNMDGGIYKQHAKTGNYAKVENTPEQAFIYNDEVNGLKCPRKLDKQWYINLANKRLGDFGCL